MRARFIQLICIYIAALLLFLFTTIPHARWIDSTVILLLASNNPGLLYQKSFERGLGTLYGVVLFVPFIYLMHINYKLIPLALILFALLNNVTTAKRHDIMVMFTTLALFTLSSFNDIENIVEGPIETMIKRFVCTLIGIFLCLIGDYLFFRRYDYTRKLYRFHQLEVYRTLVKHMNMVTRHDVKNSNRFILIDKLRSNLNQIFVNITTSGDGLFYGYDTQEATKDNIKNFKESMWQMRKLIFVAYHAKCVSQDDLMALECKAKFDEQAKIAQRSFIHRNQISAKSKQIIKNLF